MRAANALSASAAAARSTRAPASSRVARSARLTVALGLLAEGCLPAKTEGMKPLVRRVPAVANRRVFVAAAASPACVVRIRPTSLREIPLI